MYVQLYPLLAPGAGTERETWEGIPTSNHPPEEYRWEGAHG